MRRGRLQQRVSKVRRRGGGGGGRKRGKLGASHWLSQFGFRLREFG